MHYNESDCEPLLGNDRGSEETKVRVIKYIWYICIMDRNFSIVDEYYMPIFHIIAEFNRLSTPW